MQTIPDPKTPKILSQSPQNESYLLQIEGQCKIESMQALRFRYIKTIPVLILSILTIIPAIILLNFKKPRKYLFYSPCDFPEADHLYILMEGGECDIVDIVQDDGNGNGNNRGSEASERTFVFKQLRYRLDGRFYVPKVMDYRAYLQGLNSEGGNSIIQKGLNISQHTRAQRTYGKNVHQIEIQNYFHYMVTVIFQPLYILQYIVVCSLAIQGLPLFGIILVIASWLTTSGNYIAMYVGKLRIRKMAEKGSRIRVLRETGPMVTDSKDLVPGDVVIFDGPGEIPCDCVVVRGELYANECSLTGENIPIRKSAYRGGNTENGENWLYDGTQVLEAQEVRAVVIFTGFASRKGRLLRKILNRVPSQPDFFFKMFFFLLESFIIGMALYGATLPIRLAADIDMAIVVLRVLDYLVSSVPPAFPVYFTIAYSWALYRLKSKEVFSTMPEKTVEANRLKTACFDKTGTLTENSLGFKQFYVLEKNGINLLDLTDKKSAIVQFTKKFFGTCHSVRKINGEYRGDEVDLKLWQCSGFKLSQDKLDILEDQNGQQYKILVLNQFQSKFQSMSVLVRQEKTGKCYIFVKGAPEKIHSVSTKKINEYSDFTSEMSFKGLRTIAFGWKAVNENEISSYMSSQREDFLKHTQIFGIAAFENALKPETYQTIKILHSANISTRIITGDNIYIAVEIGFRSGILSPSQPVLLVEGKKFQTKGSQKFFNAIQVHKKFQNIQKIQRKYSISSLQSYPHPIAVDNSFITNPEFLMLPNIRIFARIFPDKKAFIIKLIKQEFEQEYNSMPWYRTLFGEGRAKVGMTGDGANDLMAIKEADVGVGLNGTDAVFSSAFTIGNLGNVIDIVKQGKCTTLNILQCLKFTLIANYVNLVVQILLATQATFISQTQGLYLNFLIIILIPIVMSLAEPAEKLTGSRVKDNFIGWQNQISVWGTIIILAGGLVGAYFFVTKSGNFVTNPKPSWVVGVGYNYQCQLVTFVFLAQGLILSCLGWIVYQSQPLKNRFYTTKILLVLSVLNFAAFTTYFFILYPSGLGFLNLLAVSSYDTGIQYAIIMGSILLASIFNFVLHRLSYRGGEEMEIGNNSTLTTNTNMNMTTIQLELVRKGEDGMVQN